MSHTQHTGTKFGSIQGIFIFLKQTIFDFRTVTSSPLPLYISTPWLRFCTLTLDTQVLNRGLREIWQGLYWCHALGNGALYLYTAKGLSRHYLRALGLQGPECTVPAGPPSGHNSSCAFTGVGASSEPTPGSEHARTGGCQLLPPPSFIWQSHR